MKKLLSIVLLLALVLDAGAATIIGDFNPLFPNANGGSTPVTVSGLDLPMWYNGRNWPAVTTQAQLTNGFLNVTLTPPGRYNISIYGQSTTVRVIVPANTNTYDISQLLTNVLVMVNQGISKYVQPGSGIVITTNNAGLASESLTLTGLGGNATNAYQSQVTGSGLIFSTNALQFIYTLALNANLQNWSGLAPAAKQDHASNLDLWAAISTSAKQDASANLTSWAAIAPSGKQDHSANLDIWSGRTIDGVTLVDNGGVVSAVTGGSGNVTGTGASTSGELALFNNGTANGIQRANITASTVVTNTDTRHLSFPNTITNAGGAILQQAMMTDTNAAITQSNAVQRILDYTLDVGPVSAGTGGGTSNLIAIGVASNVVQVVPGTGLKVNPTGPGTASLDVTVTGGAATAHLFTNAVVSQTNVFIIDPSIASSYSIGLVTNSYLRVSNTYAMTNLPFEIPLWIHQETNRGFSLLGFDVVGGLLKTNQSGNPFVINTNVGAENFIKLSLDWTRTNVYASLLGTNIGPQTAMTNTSAGGGGGGGGGGGLTLVAQSEGQGDGSAVTTTTAAANYSTCNLIVVATATSRFDASRVVSDDAANTYTLYANTNLSGFPCSIWYCYHPSGLTSSFKINFTASGDNVVGQQGLVWAFGFSGASSSPPTDGKNNDACINCTASGLTAGAINPSVNNGYIISIVNLGASGHTWAVDSGFSIVSQHTSQSGGVTAACAIYQENSTASKNPAWTWSPNDNAGMATGAFKP
jgi:hypothetical protein